MDAAATMKMTQRIGRHGQLEKCQVSRVDPQDDHALIKLIAVIVSVPQRPFNDWGRSAYAWTWATNQYPAMGLRPAEGLAVANNLNAQGDKRQIHLPDGRQRSVKLGVWDHGDWRSKEYSLLLDKLYAPIVRQLQSP
jgi:hypothetical protein